MFGITSLLGTVINVVANSNPITMLMVGIAIGFVLAIVLGNFVPSVAETRERLRRQNDWENLVLDDLGTCW